MDPSKTPRDAVAAAGFDASDPHVGSPARLVGFAFEAWRATPAMRIEDAYKWLFQATRGGEHAAPDAGAARRWLAHEWRGLPPAAPRPEPIEWLRPDGAYVRLHLVPVKARGVDEAAVLRAFLEGTRSAPTSPAAFTTAWDTLGAHLRTTAIGHLGDAAWQRLDAATRPSGFPAVHHSGAYREAYAPAYRVLTRAAADRLLS